MKTLSKNTNLKNLQAACHSQGAEKSKPAANAAEIEIVAYVFERLIVLHPAWKTAISGNEVKWSSNYRKELLLAIIKNKIRTEEDIERGLAAAAELDSDFLPNPGKFAKWCKPLRSHPSHKLFSDQKALPSLPASRETVRSHVADLQAMLR